MGSSTAGTLGEEERMTQLRDAAVQLEALMVQGEKYHIEAEIMSPVHSAYFIVKGALRTHRHEHGGFLIYWRHFLSGTDI